MTFSIYHGPPILPWASDSATGLLFFYGPPILPWASDFFTGLRFCHGPPILPWASDSAMGLRFFYGPPILEQSRKLFLSSYQSENQAVFSWKLEFFRSLSMVEDVNYANNCLPNQPSRFLFAYSNDLTGDQVMDSWNAFASRSNLFFDSYEISRFDRFEEGALITSDINSMTDGVLHNLPNATESFPDASYGSDILNIMEWFLSDPEACGSTMFIIMKRLPNTQDISQMASLLQQRHSHITVIISENPSGGLYQDTMYKLASQTNGICFFEEDEMFGEASYWLPSIWPLFLVYSVNAKVSGTESISLPSFNAPFNGNYYFGMTLQDHGPLDTFRMLDLKWYNSGSLFSGGCQETLEHHINWGNDTYIGKGSYQLDAVNYEMTLGFEFSDNKEQILQIRFYSYDSIDYWLPYDN
ncbi:hypothetical protein CRE_08722 [Caenorhabditis remanei]|uniref:DUF7154 domain-containing protein n=1 Tax=Caenorhabditis remanei TaxID=31234 RepID=E3LJJ0_CAERE|nr:hypothetical protein CRE_08722 [Caenorhabditis remanei]